LIINPNKSIIEGKLPDFENIHKEPSKRKGVTSVDDHDNGGNKLIAYSDWHIVIHHD